MWLLTLDLSKESLNAIKNNDIDALKHIYLMDYSINKFSNYCLRLLIKKGHVNFKKTPSYYHLIKNLEGIADRYKDMCSFYLNKNNIDNDMINVFSEVNNHLNEFYELFYKYDEQKIEELFRKTKLTCNKTSDLSNQYYNLYSICVDIRNLLSVLVEINLG